MKPGTDDFLCRLLLHQRLETAPVDNNTFHDAALLTLDAEAGLRAGDALHLASAMQVNATRLATLDAVFARNAKRLKIAVVM